MRFVTVAENLVHLRKENVLSDPLKVSTVKSSQNVSALTFFYSNVRSLLPKIDHFRNYVSVYNPTIIGVTESWLTKDIPNSLFCPVNYNVFRKDRLYTKGGGALLLVSKEIVSHSVSIPVSESCKIDAVACCVTLQEGKNVGILCVYRPPNLSDSDNADLLPIMSDFLSKEFHYCIILGDFNFPDIKWPCSASASQSELFLNFVQDNFLQQHVLQPTRRSSNSVLDLVLSTPGSPVSNLSVNEEFSNSDHSIIQFSLCMFRKNKCNTVLRRNLRNADWYRFRSELSLSLVNWQSYLSGGDIDTVWRELLLAITKALDEVAPYRALSNRCFMSSPRVRTALVISVVCFTITITIPASRS